MNSPIKAFAKDKIYPSLTEFHSNFSHIYLTLIGHIKIHGDSVISMEDIYHLVTAEANCNHLSELEKDVLDIVMWTAKHNTKSCIHRHGECSIFFGPDTLVSKIIPMERIFILSKRSSFFELISDVNICTEGQWEFKEKDWMIEMKLKGHTKKLTQEESRHYSVGHKNFYIKSDKYNPYIMSEVP
ncbi:TPA_asm: M [Fraxinus gammacytorhabdovirus 1]|nr:TPA_asm: M [Fraxinus gammacytorhabdovirus 1]